MPPIQPGDRRGINVAKRWGRTFFKSDLAMDLIDRGSDSTHSTPNPRDDAWYTDAPNRIRYRLKPRACALVWSLPIFFSRFHGTASA